MDKDLNIDNFTRHYLIAMLWSTTDESAENVGDPLEVNYGIADLAPEAFQATIDDCRAFQRDNAGLLTLAYEYYINSGIAFHPDAGSPEACAGHDFWLTRCGHGAGFWCRGMPGDTGDKLSKSAERYGNIDPYVGDDGFVYFG